MDSSDEEGVPTQVAHASDDAASVGSSSSRVARKSAKASESGSDVSAPHSPAGSDANEHSGEEVHISEAEVSDHESDNDCAIEARVGSDAEENSENEADESVGAKNYVEEKESDDKPDMLVDTQQTEHDSVPEINIESGDEDNDAKGESQDLDNSKEIHSDSEASRDATDEVKVDEKNEDVQRHSEEVAKGDSSDDEEGEKSAKVHSEEEDDLNQEDQQIKKNRRKVRNTIEDDSDAEEESENEKPDYGDLIANIFGESDDDEEFEGFDKEDIEATRRKKEKLMRASRALSESDEEKSEEEEEEEEETAAAQDSADESEQQKHESEPELEQEMEEESAPQDEPIKESEKKIKVSHVVSDDDSDDDGVRKSSENFVSDFETMMQKKKEESSRRRKRKDVDIINDSDDLIAEIIAQMRQAADEDRFLNKQKKTATKKLKSLPLVASQLKKQDLKMAFLDQGVLNVIADWLAPLPDRSLPHLQIREGMIKLLDEFPPIDHSLLKSSGIGRVLMYLFKHPKETKENKERAGRLITEWARPIFNVTTDYHSLTKEEREQRDFDHVPKRKKMREQPAEKEASENKDIDKALSASDRQLRPGDKGWVGRARVPLPSNRDYVVRPKWNVEMEFGRSVTKKPMNRFEKHMRTQQEKKRASKGQRAVTISIEGRKMAI